MQRIKIACCAAAVAAIVGTVTANAEIVALFNNAMKECEGYGFAGAIGGCLLEKDDEEGSKLTATYRTVLKKLPHAEQEIKASQRAWLAFQKTSCEASKKVMEREGKGSARFAYGSCMYQSTLRRHIELRILAGIPNGGREGEGAVRATDNRQMCEGVIAYDEDGDLQLMDISPNESLWCAATIGDGEDDPVRQEVLSACSVGSRCAIDGVFGGRGVFYWLKVHSVARVR